jgi:formylglycine-generating enzyme required for sulfatase activity
LTWKEASAFCRFYGAELPTAAQRERAAKGGSGKDEYGTPIDLAIIKDNGATTTALVIGAEAERRSNDLGFVDLAGNVRDWTRDRYEVVWYHWSKLPIRDPHNPLTSLVSQAVELRGGSWRCRRWPVRAARRHHNYPWERHDFIGFRPAWPQDPVS